MPSELLRAPPLVRRAKLLASLARDKREEYLEPSLSSAPDAEMPPSRGGAAAGTDAHEVMAVVVAYARRRWPSSSRTIAGDGRPVKLVAVRGQLHGTKGLREPGNGSANG
eukprot:scaffold16396_cov115-Isochrysis_galbana.AAC.6